MSIKVLFHHITPGHTVAMTNGDWYKAKRTSIRLLKHYTNNPNRYN